MTDSKRAGPRKTLRSVRTVLGIAFHADPWRAAAVFALQISTALANALWGLWLKLLTDAAVGRDSRAVVWAAAGMAGSVIVGRIAFVASFGMRVALDERVGLLIDQRIIALTTGIPGIEHHERPEYLDELELLRSQRDQLGQAVGSIVDNVSLVVRLAGTSLLLVSLHPLLLTLPLFAVPSFFATARAERQFQKMRDETAEPTRLATSLFDLATTSASGKELRLFGLRGEIAGRHEKIWEDVARREYRVRMQSAVVSSAGWLFFAAGFVGAILFVTDQALKGRATAGDVMLALSLASQINWQMQGAVWIVSWMARIMKVVGRYLWLVDYARDAQPVITDPMPVPGRISAGIELDRVSFRYPGTDEEVLTDVSLRLPAGSTVALVGENGAGKTTLVKLLCRFYEPTSGVVTLDGVDVRRFDPADWRTRTSAGFQDFARFELVARETVGVGDLAYIDDPMVVAEALDRASASEIVEGLHDGFDTQLGRSFEDGVELSAGQWQKLALGRAMMRLQPLLVVFDEPTASLDAQTEHALFERYAGAALRFGRESGAITILVSHRFSTVRMADLIVVIDGGRVTEAGSHAELMANESLYSELYEIQARAYR